MFMSLKNSNSGKWFYSQAASCIHAQILYTLPELQKKNKLKQTIVPTISSREIPTKNMAVLKAPEGMDPKSRALPLHTSSPVMGFPMQ